MLDFFNLTNFYSLININLVKENPWTIVNKFSNFLNYIFNYKWNNAIKSLLFSIAKF